MSVKYISRCGSFQAIPVQPIAYWASPKVIKCFEKPSLSSFFITREGMATADNDRFLRMWYEIENNRITFDCKSETDGIQRNIKWVPYNKGGGTWDWYGNNDYVVNWANNGHEIKNNIDPKTKRIRSHNYNGEWGFQQGITWSAISSDAISVRYTKVGFLFDSKGAKGFCQDKKRLLWTLGLLNSKISSVFLEFLSPTLDYKVGDVIQIPYLHNQDKDSQIVECVERAIEYAKNDWDSFETSWNFDTHPLVKGQIMGRLISEKYKEWESECENRFHQLKANEEELNRIFIDIYGLQDELTPDVEERDITVRLADKERDIKSLISYLVGIVMGRYSLDVEGLAYAGGEWDASKYRTYQPDEDGIVPVYEKIGMEDSLTARIIELIKLVYGEDTYRQNIDFIAEALGKNSNESSEETLNRYLNDGFYADHLKVYQKRPIYWMFSSGKNSGFKCLIYMHRYNKDTLAAINGKYFLPESARLKQELDELLSRIEGAEGRERIRLEKERQKLAAAYNEAIEYGQVLDHMANKYIEIDLDDGVKVNYAKFQAVEMVNDSGTKVKKDLLVPIK